MDKRTVARTGFRDGCLSIDQVTSFGISLGHVAIRHPDRPNFPVVYVYAISSRVRLCVHVRVCVEYDARIRGSHARARDTTCTSRLHTPGTLQEQRRVKEEDRGGCRGKKTAIDGRVRERSGKRERDREERLTQTLAKLRPSLTSGYIARVNELAPADDQGL